MFHESGFRVQIRKLLYPFLKACVLFVGIDQSHMSGTVFYILGWDEMGCYILG